MAREQATESSTGTLPPEVVAGLDHATGEVLGDKPWELPARFVGFQEPKAWSMADDRNPGQTRSGTTYRVDVRVTEGTVLMKVSEEIYKGMVASALDFGDRIAILYGRVVSGGEMRIAPLGFRRL